MAQKLAKWIARRDDGAFVVDPDIVYPAILKGLGVNESDWDQYWIETAYQCAKLGVQDLIAGTEFDPRPKLAIVIIIDSSGARKERWALKNFKPGKGIGAATKGREAKAHYQALGRKFAA